MELIKAIKERRSIRSFEDKKVEKKLIDEIIGAANYAPSACNFQLWKFIVIDNIQIKNKIVDMGGAIFIKDAPIAILVLYDNRTDNMEYRDYIQSASAAVQNMLLMVHSLGLGSCWICQLPPKKQLRKILKIPSTYDPIACIAIGYPNRIQKPQPRKNKINDIISYNKFNFKIEKRHNSIKIILRLAYMRLPVSLKKLLRPFVEKRFVKKFHN